jgi:hypothetical protein
MLRKTTPIKIKYKDLFPSAGTCHPNHKPHGGAKKKDAYLVQLHKGYKIANADWRTKQVNMSAGSKTN